MCRSDIDNFGEANDSIPPSCLISVYGSPGAVPSLHYAVPLVGVADPAVLYIHRSLRIPPTSSVNTSPAGSYKSCIVTCVILSVGPVAVVTATSPVQATRGGGNDNYVCTCCV